MLSQAQYIDKLARDMKETGAAGLQERLRRLVLELRPALDYGLLYYHTHISKHSPAGFPDVTIVMPDRGRLILAELKRQRERPTLAQWRWLNALAELADMTTHIEVYLWRPRDLLDGTIGATLKIGPADNEWLAGSGVPNDPYSKPRGVD